ncbi:MAG TPA: cupin domain-containing protein [Micromonosporaceae bacterium]|jgi:transcriptional regulator with XRE-family HTH domain|nr:cupin domain-containing protein [Micromonosporaceae bacterium]
MSVRDASLTEADAAGTAQVDEIVSLIGPKLRGLRTAQRHSLQQLAALSDVSAAAIHKIERNGMVPTITTLLKLGAALGVPVSYFVDEDEQPPEPVHHTPADRRPGVYTPHEGLALAGITGSYRQFQTAAAVATVKAGASSGEKPLQHPGEELVYVTEGVLTFRVGEQTYALGVGDSLHFGGQVPHYWANKTRRAARAIWVALRNG